MLAAAQTRGTELAQQRRPAAWFLVRRFFISAIVKVLHVLYMTCSCLAWINAGNVVQGSVIIKEVNVFTGMWARARALCTVLCKVYIPLHQCSINMA